MGSARRVINKERFVRRDSLLELDPGHRLIRHIRGEVVIGVVLPLHLGHAVIDHRIPLIGLAADKTIELVKARIGGPTKEGTGD